MAEITQKPQEVVQAQLAAFAAERIEYFRDSEHVFEHLGEIAAGEMTEVTKVLDSPEYHNDDTGGRVKVPEGTERRVATHDEYVDFLRSVGGSRYEGIRVRADLLDAYEAFAPSIEKIRGELADPATRSQHPAHIGAGSNAEVFTISHEGKDYAVRVPRGKSANPKAIDSHLAGAVLGRGVPHLEQIVAASYEDGVTVAEIMPGKEIGNLTAKDIQQVTAGQLGELVDTIVAANKRGIQIDPKPSNFFYDPESGFGIVDYHSSKEASSGAAKQETGEVIGWASTALDNAGFYGQKYEPKVTSERYAKDLEIKQANLGVLKEYRRVVMDKLSGETLESALKDIDSRTQSAEESVRDYSNPHWVHEQIYKQLESQKERAKRDRKGKPGDKGWITLHLDEV